MFETEVLPLVTKYARSVFKRDDEKFSIALVLAWWIWSQRKEDHPATVYAYLACRNVQEGRDLPGVQPSHFRDAMGKGYQGGGMSQVRDRRPDPLTALILKEEIEGIMDDLTAGEAHLVQAVIGEGITTTTALAAHLKVTMGRVSQLKRQIAEKKK